MNENKDYAVPGILRAYEVIDMVAGKGCVKFNACVAAPVFSRQQDPPIAGVSIAAPFERINAEFFAFASECVHRVGRLLAA